MKLYKILVVILVLMTNCLPDADPDNGANSAVLASLTNFRSDCIYCTDTQANGGNCSCYTNITIGVCQGTAAGDGKSNSYNISCSDLTAEGTWVESAGVFHCESHTCPPEAYRAAFTADGL